jgi:hypothetical protein
MNNLAANIDGRSEGIQGNLHHIDGAHHTSAKAARLEQENPLLFGGSLGVVAG